MFRKHEGVKMDDSSEWKQVRKAFPKLNRATVMLFTSGLIAGMFLSGLILFFISEDTVEPIGYYPVSYVISFGLFARSLKRIVIR